MCIRDRVNMGSVDTPLTITIIPRETLSDITVRHVETGKIMRVADTLLTPVFCGTFLRAGTDGLWIMCFRLSVW